MTIQISDLKFPTGEFSHTELAAFNGLDRKKIWTAYQKAITDKIIKSTGNERKSGKGKAAALWIVADPTKVTMSTESVSVVVPATAPEAETVAAKPKKQKAPKVETVAVLAPADKPFETELGGPASPAVGGETIVESTPAVVPPATAPVVMVNDEIPAPSIPPIVVVDVKNPAEIVGDITPIEDKCPFCNGPLVMARTVAGGIRVWCPVNEPSICRCSENPYGYSNNVANAVKVLNEKYCRVPNNAA